MKNILFLHDTSLTALRGAELTIKQLINLGINKGYSIDTGTLKDFESTKTQLNKADVIVLNSTSRCVFELDLIEFILSLSKPFIKVEYDYNFCIRRNILCTVDKKITNCCNTQKFHLYRKLFEKAQFNIFQSPKHFEAHYTFYGEAIKNHLIMPPTVEVEKLNISNKKIENTIPFFGDLNYLKGGNAYLKYAEIHPNKQFIVYGQNRLTKDIPENITFKQPVSNDEVLAILGKTKTIICQPVWPEPSGRLAAEAFLSGCDIISNDNIGTFSFDFYPDNKAKAINEMKVAPENFWNKLESTFKSNKTSSQKKLGKVLVYKSYGGLGDIFFAIPAINKLVAVSESVDFAVEPRLVNFFKNQLKNITIVNETIARKEEHLFDNIFELGNYPAFRGYDLPHALKYPTHKKVKQHAIQHYIDTVSKLHINIDNKFEKYPYFNRTTSAKKRHYVVHHGAGFLLKIWPTEKYAQLIEKLSELYPNLDCKIIKGPEDPDIMPFFTKPMPHVELITGDMQDVGKVMSSALFHIGNDAGITHVAGAFNVPTVGIYGPTGPGSWGSFSEFNELIWGKKGVCNLRCNYDVILNCEHRICLTSVTVNRVVEAIFKVLQKAYHNKTNQLKINPELKIEFGKNDCLLKLNDNEFLLEYHDAKMKNYINDLLLDKTPKQIEDTNTKNILEVLKQQHIIFEIPIF